MTKTLLGAIAIAAALSMTFAAAPARAQLVTANDQPAEFPPSSFTGRQYVDSTGCVFVRAGFDGAVSWVPRISRSRTKLCGFTPTAVSRTELPVIADAPGTPPPSQTTARVFVRTPAPGTVAVAPRGLAAPVRQVAPRVVAATPVVQAAPRIFAPAPVATVRSVRGTCPGASAVSAQHINLGARCGPQAEHPAGGSRAVLSGGGGEVIGGNAIVLPRVAVAPVTVPHGYREAWTDGRLNPDRGKQTLSGALQTALIWTQTVPRRLVDNTTGRDMTRDYNYLVYPYTDYAKQKTDLAGGQHITVRTTGGQQMIVNRNRLSVSKTTGQTVLRGNVNPSYSTKSVRAPAMAQPAPAVSTGRYVQVGSFGVVANAQNTAATLQRAGLPVRIGQMSRAGRTLQNVMAGPFADAGQAQRALSIVRQSGFGDAFLRN